MLFYGEASYILVCLGYCCKGRDIYMHIKLDRCSGMFAYINAHLQLYIARMLKKLYIHIQSQLPVSRRENHLNIAERWASAVQSAAEHVCLE